MRDEIREQLKLLWRERHLASAARERARRGVEPAFPELMRRGPALAAAAQDRLGAREQFLDAEGLRHVVVRAQLEPEHDVGFLALGGEHEDRHVELLRAQEAADLVAVHLRQHQVEDEQIGPHRERQLQPRIAIRSGLHAVALILEVVLQPAHQHGIVFDDEHGFVHCAEGSVMVNVLPRPGSPCTRIFPPSCATSRCTMLSPSPHPACARDSFWSA